MIASALAGFLEVVWLALLPLALGLLPGTLVVRTLRLPPYFWVPITFASGTLIAYVVFWVCFLWLEPAQPAAAISISVSVVGFAFLLWESGELRAYLRARDAWLPGVLALVLLAAYLACLRSVDVPVFARFTIPLTAEDHLFPKMLADRFFGGFYRSGNPPPMTTQFLLTRSSDRPPLQAAVVLALRGVQPHYNEWTYQVVGTVCQLGWVPALYALARAIGATRRQLAFVLAGAAFSGFFLLNSIYTWPKLLAAWLLLTALALMVHAIRHAVARTIPMFATIGALLALSLLAHGGPFFSILALPVLFVMLRAWRVVRPVHLAAIAVAATMLLAPWVAYQRYFDPPGTLVVKLHLAGVEDPFDSRSTLEAIADAYRRLTWSEHLWRRWTNVQEQWLVFGKSGRSKPADWVQWQQFFHQIPALDFLALGYIAMAIRRPRASAAAAKPDAESERDRWLRHLTWYVVAATLVWIVLLIAPNNALVHHGSYATTALLFFTAAMWLAKLPAWAGGAIMALHIGCAVVFWMPTRTLESASPTWNPWTAVLMATAFVAFLATLRVIPGEEPPVSPSAAR